MGIRVSIVADGQPYRVEVDQPDEPHHVRDIATDEGYDFELKMSGTIRIGAVPAAEIDGDETGQKPTPDKKPDAGQTSDTSELNRELPPDLANQGIGE